MRRLKTLCRRYKTLPLTDSGCPCDDPALHDAYLEWKSILKATGYDNSWKNWILSFEVIPAVTFWLPTYEVLDTMTQITQHDCDHACRDESNKRAQRFCAKVHIDVQDDYGRMCYKLIQAKESSPLAEVPVSRTTTARLLRSTHGQTALVMDDNFELPPFSKLSLDDAVICLVRQEGKKLFFRHVSGNLPACGCLTVSFVAVTSDEIGNDFLRFWSKMWLRDHRSEQFDCTNWRSFCDLLDATSMPATPQIVYPFSCVKTWMRLIRSLPAGKAVGPCGWSNDELKLLPECCISDLAWIFQKTAVTGLRAKTVLLAKIPTPLSMNHARPIAILSRLYRLFGRFIFRHTSSVWRQHLPFPISGGLPGRGVKELAHAQKRAIEDAVSQGKCIGGFSLDITKAYNTFGRLVITKIMLKLGMPVVLLEAWVSSLDVMVRYPQIHGAVTEGIASTTGVPEGCSISVLAMLATSAFYFYRLSAQHVRPFAYADNWSWRDDQDLS